MNIYADTHVHCYNFDKLDSLLDYAHENLQRQAKLDKNTSPQFVLFFTDGNQDKTWQRLSNVLQSESYAGSWLLSYTDNQQLIHASRNKQKLILAPARQINSKERLEFLLLGCSDDIRDGGSAEQIIEQYHQTYPIISPWGVGKWLGKRGKLMTDLLSKLGKNFMLGDNGGRPGLWAIVPHFKQTPLPVLNGSDPLPLEDEIKRVGNFGIHFQLNEEEVSLESLKHAIKSEQVTKHNFGQPLTLIKFIQGRIGLSKLKA